MISWLLGRLLCKLFGHGYNVRRRHAKTGEVYFECCRCGLCWDVPYMIRYARWQR